MNGIDRHSLRWHYPDQVLRVKALIGASSQLGSPSSPSYIVVSYTPIILTLARLANISTVLPSSNRHFGAHLTLEPERHQGKPWWRSRPMPQPEMHPAFFSKLIFVMPYARIWRQPTQKQIE